MRRAALAALALAALAGPAAAGDGDVSIVAPAGSRLAAELTRELAASGFAAARAERKPARAARVVEITGGDARVAVRVSDDAGGPPRVEAERALDARDALARRRLCLAIVEILRVAGHDGPAPAEPPAPAAPVGAPATAPVLSATPAPVAAAVAPAEPGRRWLVGVGARLELASSTFDPVSHLAFTGRTQLSPHVAAAARALWPLVGERLDTETTRRRAWSFGGTVGLEAGLDAPAAAWQPYLGALTGLRLLIAQVDFLELVQSRTDAITSALVGVDAGVRVRVAPAVHLYAELEAGRALALGSGDGGGFGGATLGLLFEN